MSAARSPAFIYRWRLPLSALIVARRARCSSPRANITHIDNDITAWFSKDDPVYQGLRAVPGRVRRHAHADRRPQGATRADRLFSRETLAFLDAITGDIERVDTVQRVASLATATIVDATPAASAADDGGLDVRPLLEDLDTRAARRRQARARSTTT